MGQSRAHRKNATRANAAYALPVAIARAAPPVVELEEAVPVATAAGLNVIVAAVPRDCLVSVVEVLLKAESLSPVMVESCVICVVEGLSEPAVLRYPHSKLQPSREFGCPVVTPGHSARHLQ
jgi:hypothetical protein